MIHRALACCLTLGLVACATGPQEPTTASTPSEAAPERKPDLPPVDLTPVPFEVARANFVRDTAARYKLDPAYIESVLAQAQIR